MAMRKTKLNRSNDPWSLIGLDPTQLLGRRAEGEHPLTIYWVTSAEGAPGLLVRGVDSGSVPKTFPKPRGVLIQVDDKVAHTPSVTLFLQTPENKDVFLTLCKDVIEFSATSGQAAEATAKVFRRLAHWQSLLAKGNAAELAPHEIRGLIGELWFLEDLSRRSSMKAAIGAWVAPDDHPQDFALDSVIVEVKARLAGSRPHVSISSLEQLETGHLPLFLLVTELAPSEAPQARSLNALVTTVRQLARSEGADVEELLEAALHRRGYTAYPAYDVARYAVSGVRTFAVLEDFPRIIRSATDLRVPQATYSLDLTTLASYEREIDNVLPTTCIT
jgi:hypothetical protein